MKKLTEVIEELRWLGEVINFETIGKYQIATYKVRDFDTNKITDELLYYGYVNGQNIMNESFESLEKCLVCNIACDNGDTHGDAGRYFIKMIK